jgi:hypothetical protein
MDVMLAGRPIRMIEPHDLIAIKLRAGRLKDDYDISEILRANAVDEQRLLQLIDPAHAAHFQQIKSRS